MYNMSKCWLNINNILKVKVINCLEYVPFIDIFWSIQGKICCNCHNVYLKQKQE